MSQQWYHISILWHELCHKSYFVHDLGVEKGCFINPSYPSPPIKAVHIKKGGWEDKEVRMFAISCLCQVQSLHCEIFSAEWTFLSQCHYATHIMFLLLRNNLCICLKPVTCSLMILDAVSRFTLGMPSTSCLSSKKQKGWKPGSAELGGRAPVVWIEARISFPLCSHKVNLKKIMRKYRVKLFVIINLHHILPFIHRHQYLWNHWVNGRLVWQRITGLHPQIVEVSCA